MIEHTFKLTPVEQQRPRAARIGDRITMYDPKKVKQFKRAVAQEAMLTYHGKPLTSSLAVDITFFRPIQKSVSRAERKRRMMGEHLPIVKPDLDNYVKSFLDALHGIYWKDDSLITDLHAKKRYDDPPCIKITVQADSQQIELF